MGISREACMAWNHRSFGLISQENDDRLSDVKAELKTRKEQRAFDTIRGYSARRGRSPRRHVVRSQPPYTTTRTPCAGSRARGFVLAGQAHRTPRSGAAGFMTSLTELITGKP